jgi:hypothetical protein
MGVAGIVAIIAAGTLTPLGGAVLALAWARWKHIPWRDFGLAAPRSWIVTIALGVGLGVALKLLLKAVVMPLFGAPAMNPAYHYLVGNTPALVPTIAMVVVGGGFGEEVFFRGFAFERLGKLLGTSPRARMLIVALTTAWFAAMHIPEQGIYGAEQALITGATFGTLYGATGTLWLPMIAHAAFDVAAVALIYADLELAVAQLFFR